MLAIRLEKELEDRLNTLAERSGRTKSFYVRKMIEEHIEDWEDYEVYLEARKNYKKEDYEPMEDYLKANGMENLIEQKGKKATRKTAVKSPT